jgi:Nucleoside 2-deoxyribosyltransferase
MRTPLPSPPRVYLAGPDVFFPEPLSIARTRKAFLAEIGLIGVFPLDSQGAQSPSSSSAAAIFRTNCELIDSCPGVLANLSPFRGPSADVGTAWELGYAFGRGKPVSAYSDDLSATAIRFLPAVGPTPPRRQGTRTEMKSRTSAISTTLCLPSRSSPSAGHLKKRL